MSVESQATVWITGAAGRMGRTISAPFFFSAVS